MRGIVVVAAAAAAAAAGALALAPRVRGTTWTRLQFHDFGSIGATYGLGIMQLLNVVGHEGEAIGWEGWAGQDPETGVVAVVFTNSCNDSGAVFGALRALDPAFDAAMQGG